ncbi:MAG: phosphate/phosphite/phosphonate ABC transporter substrate-binding protein [Devosiaceae bacterium]
MTSIKRLPLFLALFWALFGATHVFAQTGGSPVTSAPLAPPSAGLTLNLESQNAPRGEVFDVGFLADAAPGQQQRQLLPFRRHMEAVLLRPVELLPYRDARALIQAMRRGNVDYAIAPSSLFAATHRACACVEPLASQPNLDGSSGLVAALLSSENGPIGTLADLDQARITVVGEGSAVAHRIGLAELWLADVRLNPDKIAFSDTLEAAVTLLAGDEADAILTWSRQAEGSTLFDQEPFNALDQDARANLRFVWRSRAIPTQTHFAHTGLEAETIATLRAMLTRLTGTNGDAFDALDQGSGRAFVTRTLSDYQAVFDAFSYWDQAAP